jgi:phenylpyruvate tautomerase
MPLIRVQLTASLDTHQQTALMTALSTEVASCLGKPESYMMVVVEPETSIILGGKGGPAAFAEVRSVGTISPDQARNLATAISDILEEKADIPASRTYTNFAGVPGSMWGFNRSTFG